MNPRSTKMLAIAAAALLLGVVLVNTVDNDYDPADAGLLLPDLKARLNDVTSVTIASGDESATLERRGERWAVADREGYPADTGKLRAGLLALADAARLEAKTANPERHAELGLAGDDSTRVVLSGDGGVDTAVILGNVAQRSYRYARLDGAEQTWLIDGNPELPAAAADWLVKDLLDVDADDVVSVTITHADGEKIVISASDDVDAQYRVADIPDGRELRYASIVNAVAGVLNGLSLEDVRAAGEGEHDVETVFRSADGLVVTARRHEIDGVSWFAFDAEAASAPPADGVAGDADEAAAEDDGGDAPDAPAADDSEDTVPAAERAATINAAVDGWLFRLPTYKRDQLTRRWEDLLKPLPDEDADTE